MVAMQCFQLQGKTKEVEFDILYIEIMLLVT